MTTPHAISDILDPDNIRVQLYASNQTVHAPLVGAVEAGANGRLLPAGGEATEALMKTSPEDYAATWSRAVALRAFANIEGGATPTIREQFNVDSVVQNATGDYSVTWSESVSTTASVIINAGDTGIPGFYAANLVEITANGCRFQIRDAAGSMADCDTITIQVAGLAANFLLLSGDQQSTGRDKLELAGDAQPGVVKTSDA